VCEPEGPAIAGAGVPPARPPFAQVPAHSASERERAQPGSAGVPLVRLLSGISQTAQRRQQIETLLDSGHGACHLRDPHVAALVEAAILHFDGSRYRAVAWVVMPNHVHVVVEIIASHSLSSVVQSWKSFTAKAANTYLGRTGAFWQREYFDHAIRNERHLASAVRYIHDNPCKAGLVERQEDWVFGSVARYAAIPAGGTPALHVARTGSR
jgi:REP element-mobilizing transposase RayT